MKLLKTIKPLICGFILHLFFAYLSFLKGNMHAYTSILVTDSLGFGPGAIFQIYGLIVFAQHRFPRFQLIIVLHSNFSHTLQ